MNNIEMHPQKIRRTTGGQNPKNNKIGSQNLTADYFYQFAEMLLNRIGEPFD